MAESILTSVKKSLGLLEAYTPFDEELILHINGVLADLHQLGVGPVLGFAILDKDQTWEEFLGVVINEDESTSQIPILNNVKSYVSMRVRLIFDPPESHVLTAYEKLIEQATWRITVAQDELSRPPVVVVVAEEDDPLPLDI